MTIGEFGNGIRKYFNADPNKFLWKSGLLIFGRIMIDILYLEEWLSGKPNYKPNDSIRDNLIAMYGKEATEWVERLI